MDKAQEHIVFLVFDFEAEELDVTVMEKREDGDLQVKSVASDTQLGGTDMDNVLVNYLIGEFKIQSGIDIREDIPKVMRIKEAAEKTRIELSRVSIADVNLPFLAIDPLGNVKNFELTITRAILEELVMPIIEKSRKPLMRALTDTNIIPSELD